MVAIMSSSTGGHQQRLRTRLRKTDQAMARITISASIFRRNMQRMRIFALMLRASFGAHLCAGMRAYRRVARISCASQAARWRIETRRYHRAATHSLNGWRTKSAASWRRRSTSLLAHARCAAAAVRARAASRGSAYIKRQVRLRRDRQERGDDRRGCHINAFPLLIGVALLFASIVFLIAYQSAAHAPRARDRPSATCKTFRA